MSRRQTVMAGMERKENPAVREAADRYRDARDERMAHSKTEKQRKLELIAVMQAHKIKKYKFDDDEGEELLVAIEDKVDVSVKKTGEAESAIGESVERADDPSVPQGLIDQALKAQADKGVAENDEGDVVPPNKSVPKKKRGKAKKS